MPQHRTNQADLDVAEPIPVTTTTPDAQARLFLETVFGGLPDTDADLRGYLWTLPNRHTTSFRDAGHAAELADRLREGRDVYCGVALSRGDLPRDKRVSNDTAAGLVALVADLDFGTPQKPQCPPDEAAALGIVDALPAAPTLVVHSGHGLHVWWVFAEPWIFEGDEEREGARDFARSWGALVKAEAARQGFAGLDAVHDLARVLRVPGTINRKDAANLVPVRLLRAGGPQFDPTKLAKLDELQPHVQAARAEATAKTATRPTAAATPDAPAEATPDAPFPSEKHEALCDNIPEYEATWGHKRRDLRGRSLSQFDQALANVWAQADWSDAEMYAGILAHRVRWAGKLGKPAEDDLAKAVRTDYLQRTIDKARQYAREAEAQAAREAEVQAEAVQTQRALEAADPASRAVVIAELAKTFGIDLTNIQRLTGSIPILRFTVAGTTVELQQSRLLDQRAWRAAVFGTASVAPRQIGAKARPGWDALINAMARVAEDLDAGDEATVDGELIAILRALIEQRGLHDAPSGPLDAPHLLFRREKRVWFRSADVGEYARQTFGMRASQCQLAQRLTALGGQRKTHAVRKYGGREGVTTARFWGVAEELVDEEAR